MLKLPARVSHQRPLITNVIWNLVATVASRGSTLVVTIVIARLLGASEYGALGIVQSTIGMFGVFAGMGLGATSTKYIAELKCQDPLRVGRIIGLTHILGSCVAVLACLILVMLAPWLATNRLANSSLTVELQVGALLLLFSTVTGVQAGTLAGFEAFKALGRIGVIKGLCTLTMVILGAYLGGGLGAIFGMLASEVVACIAGYKAINAIASDAKIVKQYRSAWQEISVLKKTAIPVMMTGVMVGPVIWYANTLVVNQPGGYAQLGIFNAVNQWNILFMSIAAIGGGVLLPRLAATADLQDNRRLEKLNLFGNWLLITPFAMSVIAFPWLASWVYGAAYEGKTFDQSLSLMMLVSIVLAFKEGLARKLMVKNLMWWGLLSNSTWGAFFMACVYWFRDAGAYGLALAYLISYVTSTLIFVPFYLHKKVVPCKLLFSKTTITVWTVIIVFVGVVVLTDFLWARILSLLIAVGLLISTTRKCMLAET